MSELHLRRLKVTHRMESEWPPFLGKAGISVAKPHQKHIKKARKIPHKCLPSTT
jgi:hypothetical protein